MSSAQQEFDLSPAKPEQVLLLGDWDNIWYSLQTRFGVGEMDIERRMRELMKWINKNIGGLFGQSGFMFAPEHLSLIHQQICIEQGFKLFTCPKKILTEPMEDPKTGKMKTEMDTVDDTIMWFAKSMVGHPNFKTVCLISGDKDYIPLLLWLKEHGIRIALAPPTLGSLAKDLELVGCVDESLITRERMLFVLDKI